MATYRENIAARLESIAAELAAMDSSKVGGKANVKSQDGGTTIDHVGYRKSLLDEMKQLRMELAEAAAVDAAVAGDDVPFEISTEFIP